MIFDRIVDMCKYKGISSNLDTAIEYISNSKIDALVDGKTEIKGKNFYVNVIQVDTTLDTDDNYEYHRNYIDIHLDIKGSEKILFSDLDGFKIIKEYDEVNDFGLGIGKKTTECIIDKKHFCICMPNEPHKPCINADHSYVRKAIFKILMS